MDEEKAPKLELEEQLRPEDIPEWHIRILKERLAEAEANPGAGRPWREFIAELLRENEGHSH